ncbi:MAG TPA: TonB family protein [Reyranella sp.]|jgi:protein TonB
MSTPSYIQPLSRKARWGVLVSVIVFHAGVGWALASVQPKALTVGDVASMEVRMVSAEQPPQPPEPPVQLDVPPPEDTPPPEVPQLESMIQPPMPDLPPPEFPVQAPPPKPPVPKPPPPKPQPPKPHPQQATPAPAPTPQPTQQATTAAPQTLSIFQVSYSVRPMLVYPVRERRAGHHGTTQIRAYIDASGVPQQVVVERSSGYPALDEAAVEAMRKARVNTGGRAFSVTGPFTFNLAE